MTAQAVGPSCRPWLLEFPGSSKVSGHCRSSPGHTDSKRWGPTAPDSATTGMSVGWTELSPLPEWILCDSCFSVGLVFQLKVWTRRIRWVGPVHGQLSSCKEGS